MNIVYIILYTKVKVVNCLIFLIFRQLLLYTYVIANELQHFIVACDTGKNPFRISVCKYVNRQICRNYRGFLPEKPFIDGQEELG